MGIYDQSWCTTCGCSIKYGSSYCDEHNELVSYKYTFACDPDACDCLIELTTSDAFGFPANVTGITCPIGRTPNLLSVVPATILPITKKKEETMETMNLRDQIIQELELKYGNEIQELKNQIDNKSMTLNWIENDVETTKTYSESDVRALAYRDKSYQTKMNEYYLKESKLRNLLEEEYANSDEQETLAQIAEIFDVPLTKEIEVTAYIRVDMTVEIDMIDGEYDLENLITDNLYVDANGGEINVNGYEVTQVEEGTY
jgi:hypothetical protein